MILELLERTSKYLRSNPLTARYFLLGCRRVLEPAALAFGLKISSGTFRNNLEEIFLASGIRPNTILDVGAAIGKWSRAAHEVFPQAAIYAFEPLPGSYRLLRKNIAGIPNMTAYNVALSDRDGDTDFWMNEFNDSSSLLEMTEELRKDNPVVSRARRVRVAARRLDNISGIKIERPCYVKVDTEGAEKLVLEGMGLLLGKVDVLHLEYQFKKYFSGKTEYSELAATAARCGLTGRMEINTEYLDTDGSKTMSDFIFFRKDAQ